MEVKPAVQNVNKPGVVAKPPVQPQAKPVAPKPVQPPLVNSLGAKLDRVIEAVSKVADKMGEEKPQAKTPNVKVVIQQPKEQGKSTYSDKVYDKVEMEDGGMVKHPYDLDCPYCHNIKGGDAIAARSRIRTTQSMRDFER